MWINIPSNEKEDTLSFANLAKSYQSVRGHMKVIIFISHTPKSLIEPSLYLKILPVVINLNLFVNKARQNIYVFRFLQGI